MKAIIALENLIKEEEKRVALAKKQLSEHESGENKLSFIVKASTETTLEDSKELLDKHTQMLNELLQQDIKELEEQEKIKEAIIRANYYKYQKIRLKRDKIATNDQKLEAMMIIDELPNDIQFEDAELLAIAQKVIDLNITVHEELNGKLNDIIAEYHTLKKDFTDEDINSLDLLNYRIPIIVLHIAVLVENIKENVANNEKLKFNGFPKYEDWWISELWVSHQAYLSLYKWKTIVKNQCNTDDQKRAWENIFSNWIFIKKLLNSKKELGFKLNYVFDKLLAKYGEFEEETNIDNILSMESIVQDLTLKEDFLKNTKSHNVETPYLKYKLKYL